MKQTGRARHRSVVGYRRSVRPQPCRARARSRARRRVTRAPRRAGRRSSRPRTVCTPRCCGPTSPILRSSNGSKRVAATGARRSTCSSTTRASARSARSTRSTSTPRCERSSSTSSRWCASRTRPRRRWPRAAGAGSSTSLRSPGFQPGPMNATYGATKAFVTSFTEAVHEELRAPVSRSPCCAPGSPAPSSRRRPTSPRRGTGVPVAGSRRGRGAPDSTRSPKNHAMVLPGSSNKTLGTFSQMAPNALTRRLAGKVIQRSTQ